MSETSKESFEEVLARLEGTIALLADGSAPLDDLVAAHQRAAGLLSDADARLETLRSRAERLVAELKA